MSADSIDPQFRPAQKAHPGLEVEGLEALISTLEQKRATELVLEQAEVLCAGGA